MSFDYDTVMPDPDSHVFTNVNPKEDIQSEYDYMYDDFGSQVLPDDLVMKVVFKKDHIC